MSESSELEPLEIPAVRAHMGDWVYYIALMPLREVASRISFADQIHEAQSLKQLLQRSITGSRSKEIRDYLVSQPQRFFNALVIGTYGGSPNWFELQVNTEGTELDPLPVDLEGTLGILKLNGTELLWAIDGQHRVAGIKAALRDNDELGREEICVIFVKGVTSNYRDKDPAGFERTRRLFTTLNRYARPVSKKDIIALDEDDVIAIVTRRLVEEHPLFTERKISIGKARSIPPSDTRSFTTIQVLYDVLNIHLRDRPPTSWRKRKTTRPSDDTIQAFHDQAVELLSDLVQEFPPLQELEESSADDDVAEKYRHTNGGHLLFRPVGLLNTVRALRDLMEQGLALGSATAAVGCVPMDLSAPPWADLLWDTANRRMLTAPENQKVARRILFYGAGGDLTRLRVEFTELAVEYAGILKCEPSEIEIRRYA